MRIAGVADIGGTNSRVAIISDDGTILAHEVVRTPQDDDPGSIPVLIAETLHRIRSSITDQPLLGIGVSVAGPVDLKAGTIKNPPNMVYDEVPIIAPLNCFFSCPVVLMNDCRAAVLGEVFFGAGSGHRHVVYITISTGIGGGIYTGGRVLLGRGGNAGEIGHILVDTVYQHPCSCGASGHWEGYASGRGIPGFFQTWCHAHGIGPGESRDTAEEIITAAEQGDSDVNRFLQTLACINARGLSTVIVAYDPEIIILDGPVITRHPDLILKPVLPLIDPYLPSPRIVISPLGGNAPLLGVAAAVFSLHLSGEE
jgi:glucokinase